MNDASGRTLSEAYELIEAERLDEARSVLKPLLESEKDNPDVWWLYAHAVSDAEGAQLALNQVLQLDPDYPEARELLRSLEAKAPSPGLFDADFDPPFLPDDFPPTLPGMLDDDDDLPDDDFDDDFDEDEDEAETERQPLLRQPALLAALLVFVVVVVAAILLAVLNPPAPVTTDATQVAVDATETPLEFDTPVPPTIETGSSQTVPEGDYGELLGALGNFGMPEDSLSIMPTSLGDALMVKICSTDRREARDMLPQVMDALVAQASTISDPVTAVGTEIINCADQTSLLVIAAPLVSAIEYGSGGLTQGEFEAVWRPVG